MPKGASGCLTLLRSKASLNIPSHNFIYSLLPPPITRTRDAAALACVCVNAARAYREGRWPRAVRVKRNGAVFEPANGVFDVTVAPGEGVQAAVDRCPRGGCVLLQPGVHAGPLTLTAGQEVHVFGRGRATLRTTAGHVLTCTGAKATFDGLSLKRVVLNESDGCGVIVRGGALRLQKCNVTSAADAGIWASHLPDDELDLSVVECKCVWEEEGRIGSHRSEWLPLSLFLNEWESLQPSELFREIAPLPPPPPFLLQHFRLRG